MRMPPVSRDIYERGMIVGVYGVGYPAPRSTSQEMNMTCRLGGYRFGSAVPHQNAIKRDELGCHRVGPNLSSRGRIARTNDSPPSCLGDFLARGEAEGHLWQRQCENGSARSQRELNAFRYYPDASWRNAR